MKKKILSITLASAMALGTMGGAFAETHNGLEVQTSNPYIDGYPDGTFKPANDVKRAEVAKMVAVIRDLAEAAESFDDVDDEHWAAGFIGAVQEAEIVEGYPDGTFRPENGISRAEMATIVSRIIGESTGSGAVALSDINDHWAEDHIMNAVRAGIIKGYPDGTFKPDQEVTRAESVKLLNGMIGILSVDSEIADVVENPFTDIEGYWAQDDILAASTDYEYTLDAEGDLVVVKEELSVGSVAVSSDRISGEVTVTAMAMNFAEDDTATVTVTPDASLGLDDIVIEDVEIDAEGNITLDLGVLPEGTHSVVVSVGDVSSEAVEFTVDTVAVLSVRALNTSSLQVTLEGEVDDAEASSFKLMLGDEEISVASVQANEDSTVYTLMVDDLDGKEGTLEVGEYEFMFDFSTEALSDAIDLVDARAATLDAADNQTNRDELLEALEAPILNLININEEYIVDYADDIDSNLTNTRARLQQSINRVNTQKQEEMQDLIDEVNDALNIAELRTALSNLGIMNVSGTDFGVEYFDAVETSETETKVQIQAVIDSVNLAEIAALVEEAETELTMSAYSAANGVVAQDLLDEAAQEEMEERLAAVQVAIDVNAAIAAVNAEVAADVAPAALLLALQDADLDLDDVVAANESNYEAALEALYADDNAFEFEMVADIQAFVDGVNADIAIDDVNAEVAADVVAADLLAALENPVLGLDNVSSRNQEVYEVELEALYDDDNAFEFETVADIQAFVDSSNATPVGMVNTANSTLAMRTALENPDLGLDLAVYNELSGLQKNLVAQELQGSTTAFADADDVQVELDAAVIAYV